MQVQRTVRTNAKRIPEHSEMTGNDADGNEIDPIAHALSRFPVAPGPNPFRTASGCPGFNWLPVARLQIIKSGVSVN